MPAQSPLLYRNRTGNFSTASPRAGRNPVCLKPKPEDLPCKVVAPAMDDGWRKNWESGGFPCFIVPFGNFCSERFSFLKQENCRQIKFVNCGSPCCGSALTKRAERTVIRYEENRKKDCLPLASPLPCCLSCPAAPALCTSWKATCPWVTPLPGVRCVCHFWSQALSPSKRPSPSTAKHC